MGQIVNPVSLRLNKSRFWVSSWSSNSLSLMQNYYFLDYNLQKYVLWLVKKDFFLKFGIIPFDFTVNSTHNKIIINVNYLFTSESGEELRKKRRSMVLKILLCLRRQRQIGSKLKPGKRLKNNLFSTVKQNKKFIADVFYDSTYFLLKVFFSRVIILSEKIFQQIFNTKINFVFSRINSETVNSNLISYYMAIKLKQRFPLREVLRLIINTLKAVKNVNGFKIKCSGRFDRKQRATYLWEHFGIISSTTIMKPVDYSESVVLLKYGLCGLKVWISKY